MTTERRVVWRAPQRTFERFDEILRELVDLPEESERAYVLRDEIRSLPNFPYWVSEDTLIIPEETTLQ